MDNISEKIRLCSVFENIDDKAIEEILQSNGITQKEWQKNNCMEAQSGLYIICSGKVRVLKKEGGKELFLKYLNPGDSFGYAGLFSSEDYKQVTVLFAKEKTKAVFIPQEILRHIIYKNPQAAINIIRVLTEKIRFLNKKIDSFTSPTTESRLLKYLLGCHIGENNKLLIADTMSELARKLDMGRASLYRAFESLEKNGDIIRKDGNVFLSDKFSNASTDTQ